MLKKRGWLLFFVSLVSPALCSDVASPGLSQNFSEIAVHAESAVLVNAETGKVLFEKNSDQLHYPASITKIATALYALSLKGQLLDEVVTAQREAVVAIASEKKMQAVEKYPSYWLETGSSHVGIKEGEELNFESLLYAMLVASGNDAANVIAQFAGEGSIADFIEGMNGYLEVIGCRNTCFKNPHGLHHPEHRSTANDIALMARHLLQEPLLANIVKTVRYRRPDTNKQKGNVLVQTNRLLRKGPYFYPQAIGIKTGYTSQAKGNLVAAATSEGRTLIAVLLKCEDRGAVFSDAKLLFQKAFAEPLQQQRVFKEEHRFEKAIEGANRPLQAQIEAPIHYCYYPSEKETLTCELEWLAKKLPIQEGEEVGFISVRTASGLKIGVSRLIATNAVHRAFSLLQKGGFSALFIFFLFLLRRLLRRLRCF